MSGVISLRSFILLVDLRPFSGPAFFISGVAWELMSHGKLSCFLSKDIYVILFYYYYFFKLLSWCSYRWRVVVKDKDGGYHDSRWQFAVTFPRHHDHHLVWEETEFEQQQQQQQKNAFLENLLSFVRNKNVMSELYFHGRELCKSKYKFRKFPPICMDSINAVILYILTLYRPVTIFSDLRRILRFRKPLSTSIFVYMHVL